MTPFAFSSVLSKMTLQKISILFEENVLPIFFPRHCPVCDGLTVYGEKIHPACRKKLPYLRGPICFRCGKPISDPAREYCYDCRIFPKTFQKGRALFLYNTMTRPLMSAFKYQNKRVLSHFFVQELCERYQPVIRSWNIEAIIPVPVHKNKQKKRGYNQAALLSRGLARSLCLPHYDLLIRSVDTLPQKQFGPQARLNNLQKAFRLNPQYGQTARHLSRVLLVDDIYTTGATMEACTRILHRAGITHVYILSVCTGVARD